MNFPHTTTHFALYEPTHCEAHTAGGSVFLTVKVGDHSVTFSATPDVILAQLDAMRDEIERVMAEAEGVTA